MNNTARATIFTATLALPLLMNCGLPFTSAPGSGGGGAASSASGDSTSTGSRGSGGQGGSTSSITSSTSSTSSSTASSSGGGGSEASSSASAGGGGAGGCDSNQKLCSQSCVQKDDPDFGCAAAGCNPCSTSHATPSCESGSCKVTCDPDFGDCNHSVSDGCETDTTHTKAHCGSCGHACTNAHDMCTASACTTPCGVLPSQTGDFLCWVYTGPGDPNLGYVGLRGGINQDPDPFDNSSGCINQVMGAAFVLCDLGTPALTDTILAAAGVHDGNTQFSTTLINTSACTASTCQGTIIGYKAGVECGSSVNGVLSGGPNCLSFVTDSNTALKAVKFTP